MLGSKECTKLLERVVLVPAKGIEDPDVVGQVYVALHAAIAREQDAL